MEQNVNLLQSFIYSDSWLVYENKSYMTNLQKKKKKKYKSSWGKSSWKLDIINAVLRQNWYNDGIDLAKSCNSK